MPKAGQATARDDWEHAITAPPDRVTAQPPTETRKQELPFGELTWENFERLCYRLAGYSDAVEDYRRSGRTGQAQQGVDIYARLSNGKYDVWQAKQYKRYSVNNLRKAAAVLNASESHLGLALGMGESPRQQPSQNRR